jgi:hypothetical protein
VGRRGEDPEIEPGDRIHSLPPAFRIHLHDTATRATEYLRRSGLPGAAARSGETHFLRIALEKVLLYA